MIGVTFHNDVTDAGLHRIGAIMIAASVVALCVTLAIAACIAPRPPSPFPPTTFSRLNVSHSAVPRDR
jgi:hypothetical protein